ncbi:hypothetical protein [Thermoflavimicrobium daqui]|nr:hypothetical protein [Thermoflavimicrobium daqui]
MASLTFGWLSMFLGSDDKDNDKDKDRDKECQMGVNSKGHGMV